MDYPTDIDPECIAICDALNALPGIQTTSSCCGHGKRPHRVLFIAKRIQDLEPITQAAKGSAWRIEQAHPYARDPIFFLLEGPVGPPDMAGGANDFAARVCRLEKR